MTLLTLLFTTLPLFLQCLAVTNGIRNDNYPTFAQSKNSGFGSSSIASSIATSSHSSEPSPIQITALVQSNDKPLGKWILSIQPLPHNRGMLEYGTSTTYQWLQNKDYEQIVNWTDHITNFHPNDNKNLNTITNQIQAMPIHFSFSIKDARATSTRTTSYITPHQGRVFWVLLFREVETSRHVILQKLYTIQHSQETLTIDIPQEFSKMSSLLANTAGGAGGILQSDEEKQQEGGRHKGFSKCTFIFFLVLTCCIAREAYISITNDNNNHQQHPEQQELQEQQEEPSSPPLSQISLENNQNVSSVFDRNILDTDMIVLGTVQIHNSELLDEECLPPANLLNNLKVEQEGSTSTHDRPSNVTTSTRTGDHQVLNSPSLHSTTTTSGDKHNLERTGPIPSVPVLPAAAAPQDYTNQFQMSSERSLHPPHVTRKFSPTLFSSPESSITNRDEGIDESLRSDLDFIVGKNLFQDDCEKEAGHSVMSSSSSSSSPPKKTNPVSVVGPKDHVNGVMENVDKQLENETPPPPPQEHDGQPLERSAIIEMSLETTLQNLGDERSSSSQLGQSATSTNSWNIKSPVANQHLAPTVPNVIQNYSRKRDRSRVYVPCTTAKKPKRTRGLQSSDKERGISQTIESPKESYDEPSSVLARLGFSSKRYLNNSGKRRRVQPDRKSKSVEKRYRGDSNIFIN